MAEPKTPAALALLALAERGQHWVDDLGGDDDARAAMYATEVVEAVRRSVMTEQPQGCRHNATPDLWEGDVPYCRKCGAGMSAGYEMGD